MFEFNRSNGANRAGFSRLAPLLQISSYFNLLLAGSIASFFWLPSALAQSARAYFDAVDLDHDGVVSLSEYQERMSWAFHQMDRNHDDALDPDEQIVPDAPRLTLPEHHARLALQFKRQDRDHNGSLSAKEFLAPPG